MLAPVYNIFSVLVWHWNASLS